ncbi:hypothetical protein L218DRAFT_1076634 [Marasmius fiardii PR-910]|nr:hypothetical protein L218DRAFT_1076634 [Marasmius fiardii PR-910]
MLPETTVRKRKDSTVTVTMIAAKFAKVAARDNSQQQQVPPSSEYLAESMSGTYERRADDYTFNALHTFSFGNPTATVDPSTSSSSLSLAPEQESPTTTHIDVTPRPSVVGTGGAHYRYQRRKKTSPTRNSDDDEDDQSRQNFISPLKTSNQRGYSTDPSPSTSQSASAVSLEERHQVEFSSDDDLGYDFDDDDDAMEFGSSGFGGRIETEGLTSIAEGLPPSAADLRAWRRGSLPGPAALNLGTSTSTPAADNGQHSSWRDREASVATLRRPSRSLENGLHTPVPVDNESQHMNEVSSPPIIFSSPFSSSGPDSSGVGGPQALQSVDPRTPIPPPPATQSPDSQSPAIDSFGFDLAYITQGITSFDDPPISPTAAVKPPTSQFSDFVNRRPSLTPSTASGSKSPKWWNSWSFPRRHSAVSTGSGENMERINGGSMFLYDDSFSKGLLRWGGEGYREQRKEWCFRRIPDTDREVENEKKIGDDAESQSSASIISTSDEREKEKERQRARVKERPRERERRAAENWRGMAIGSEENWQNDLVGTFTVSREEVVRKGTAAETSGKSPQQRLIVRGNRKRANPENRRRELQHPPVIVHKHSKALAFSLSRYYKSPVNSTGERHSSSTYATTSSSATRRPTTPASTFNDRRSAAGGLVPPLPSQRSAARVILLAPRKVQEAFTSTTTTKMLAEYGLLNGGGEEDAPGDRIMRRRKSAVSSAPSSGGEVSSRQRSKSVSAGISDSANGKKRDFSSSPSGYVPPLPLPTSTASAGIPNLTPEPDASQISVPSPSAPISNSGFPESIRATADVTSREASPSKSAAGPSASTSDIPSYSKRPMSTGDDDSYDSQDNDDRDLVPTSSSNYSTSTGETSASGYDDGPGDSDDTDDDLLKVPFRTPHRETYSAVDASAYERQQALLLHQVIPTDSRSGLGLFDRLRSRGGRSHAGIGVSNMQPFDPPWMTFEPRGKQEQQKRVVDNLNMSFKDVGLLPSTPRERHGGPFKSNSGKVGKRKAGTSTMPTSGKGGRKRRDVFENIPPEALYMLLPLWPGETDHHSQRHYPFIRPNVPLEKRKFLLVCYKALDPKENPEASSTVSATSNVTAKSTKPGKTEGKSVTSSSTSSRSKAKLGSRLSSTSSTDSKHWDDKNILLPGFFITARQVTYADLQGSGVRMPEEGLAVSGPLEDAFRQMPFSLSDEYSSLGRRRASWSSTSDENHGGTLDLVLGACYSRESGVEFDPEGLVALGLCTVLNPLPKGTVAEELGEQGANMHQVKLTPIGMAVMEMAWIGGMALTSFGLS